METVGHSNMFPVTICCDTVLEKKSSAEMFPPCCDFDLDLGSYDDLVDFILDELTETEGSFDVALLPRSVQLLGDQLRDVFTTVLQQHVLSLVLKRLNRVN